MEQKNIIDRFVDFLEDSNNWADDISSIDGVANEFKELHALVLHKDTTLSGLIYYACNEALPHEYGDLDMQAYYLVSNIKQKLKEDIIKELEEMTVESDYKSDFIIDFYEKIKHM